MTYLHKHCWISFQIPNFINKIYIHSFGYGSHVMVEHCFSRFQNLCNVLATILLRDVILETFTSYPSVICLRKTNSNQLYIVLIFCAHATAIHGNSQFFSHTE